MKKLLYTLSLLLLTVCLFAQAPQKMNYQAVVRNANNSLVANQNVSVRITLLQGSATGAAVYTETHNVQTNANGLMTLEIGGGNAINGIFSSIDWANGPFFIKSEVDPEGGVNYNVTTTQQLMSVPYALYAETSGEHELIDSLQSEMNSLQNVVSRQDSLINALNNQIDTQSDSCVYFIRMNDSFGDGWNHAFIRASMSSGLQDITLPSGNYAMETITVVPGDSVFFFWHPGQYDDECSFTISNSSDSIVYSCQDVSTLNGIFYSGNCPLSIFDKFNILTDQISYQDSVITMLNNQINPPFNCGISTVTDHEGNVYNTVKIGEQCWTRENMRCTTSPSTGTNILEYPAASYSYTGKKAYVNDNANNTAEYGLLYNWCAAVDTFNVQFGETSTNTTTDDAPSVSFTGNRRGICPQGWHVPSNAEWTQLTNYVCSQSAYQCNGFANIAKALASTSGWYSSTTTCTVGNTPADNNATGFSAVPAGYYGSSGYGFFANGAYFWSTTQTTSDYAYYRSLTYGSANVGSYRTNKNYGYSVRCLRDGGIAGAPANNESSSTDNVGGNGLSAYEIWLAAGNTGTEADFLASLVGPQGPAGQDGAQGPQGETGPQGPQGPAGVGIPQTLTINGMELTISDGNTVQIPTIGGANGLSAYQVWLNNGNQGTEADFLASLVGPQGPAGQDGAQGPQGETGPQGPQGPQGPAGVGIPQTLTINGMELSISGGNTVQIPTVGGSNGLSAYQVWLNNGNQGTEADFLASLVGPQGETGPQGPQGPQGPAGQDGVGIAQTLSINGDQLTISDGNTVTLPSNAAQLESLQSDLNSLQNAVSTQDSVINALNNELHPQPAGGRSCPGTPTVTDHEGNVYNTVQIGNQCWTKENLRCTTSPSTGTSIIDEAQSDNSYTGKKAYYVNGDAANTAIYGLLYNWNAAVDTFNTTFGETSMNNSSAHAPSIIFSGNRRGICPQGWHIPSDEEWTQLTDYVGGLDACICGDNSEYISKAVASSTGWDNSTEFCAIGSDQSSNNVTEFTALPTGYHSGGCYDFGRYTNFWCVTQYDNSWAYTRSLHRDAANVSQFYDLKSDAFSVRCLRDAPANNGNGSTNNAGGNSECCTELGARVDNLQSQVSSLQNIVNAQNSQIDSLQQVIAGGGNIRYIVFNANGGDGFMNAQFCPMGVEQHINPLTFTRSGYVFLGWNTAADGTGTFYAKNAPITLTQNITLYAQWSTRVQMQLPDPCGSSTNTNSRTSSSRN